MTVDEIQAEVELLRQRVSMTARVFDRIGPDWYKYINPSALDMDNAFTCVIGQAGAYLFNMLDDYNAKYVWDAFRVRYAPYEKGTGRIVRMGVYANDAVEAGILRSHWQREIEFRLTLDSLEQRLGI